jgi:hypothetical protein
MFHPVFLFYRISPLNRDAANQANLNLLTDSVDLWPVQTPAAAPICRMLHPAFLFYRISPLNRDAAN